MKNSKANAILIATTACLTLTGCGSTADKIDKFIDDGKYEEAVQTFSEWKNIKEVDRSKLVEKMKENLSQAVDEYATDHISYERAHKIVDTISSLYVYELNSDVALAYSWVESLSSSKQSYSKGIDAFNNGDFLSAASYFENVVEKDRNYESAVEKKDESVKAYSDNVIAQARISADERDYEQALRVLENAKWYLNDVTAIDAEIAKLKTEKEEYLLQVAKNNAVEKAAEFVKKSDYESALMSLEEFKSEYSDNDADVNGLYDKYSEEYISFITGKVSDLRASQNYLKALEMLDNASKIINATEFASLKEEIKKEKPIYLCDVIYQNSNKYEQITDGEPVVDTIGNSYQPGNLFEISSQESRWDMYDGYADYYLGYKYNRLTGTVSVDNNSLEANCTLFIEGDGVVLQSFTFNRLSVPTPIDIDISTVNVLKFRTGDFDGNEGSFYFILSDMIFS